MPENITSPDHSNRSSRKGCQTGGDLYLSYPSFLFWWRAGGLQRYFHWSVNCAVTLAPLAKLTRLELASRLRSLMAGSETWRKLLCLADRPNGLPQQTNLGAFFLFAVCGGHRAAEKSKVKSQSSPPLLWRRAPPAGRRASSSRRRSARRCAGPPPACPRSAGRR